VSVFIAPPSVTELNRRLERRGTDTTREITERMRTSRVELEACDEFDHVIVNADVEFAARELAEVVARAIDDGSDG